MILSHKHKFIFLHNRKVAGSTIKVYLNQYLGPDDLQIGAWKETLLNGGSYNKRFYNDLTTFTGIYRLFEETGRSIIRIRGLNLSNVQKRIYRGKTGEKPEQPTAIEIKKFAPKEWENYYKFCFVRNPYDRAVSDYKWRTKNRKGISFLDFLERLYDPDLPDPEKVVPLPSTNWPIYTIDDKPAVDFIGRYENFENDFQAVCKKLNIPFIQSNIPKAKSSGNKSILTYRKWYGDKEKKLVEKIFEKELKMFDYRF